MTFLCPRRAEVGDTSMFKFIPKNDTWYERDGARACSYCGSMHPDDLFLAIETGRKVTPTDKSYKLYVDGAGFHKFYFQHMSGDQARLFTDIWNYHIGYARVLNMGYPGYFYQPPYFWRREP